MINTAEQTKWMRHAMTAAQHAYQHNEVPIGAVIVINNKLIATSYNQTIQQCDPCSHAEILCLQAAAKKIKNHRLTDAQMYVTLEPCIMCLGAIINARVKTVIYAAKDARVGAISTHQLHQLKGLNHMPEIYHGPMADESAKLLKQFFISRR
jgi:tRNA(adenine34) deaminase|tara:strand:- start:2425 stop:2880 length:456 start_codon:yes stop_codon:yes gene_type:complete